MTQSLSELETHRKTIWAISSPLVQPPSLPPRNPPNVPRVRIHSPEPDEERANAGSRSGPVRSTYYRITDSNKSLGVIQAPQPMKRIRIIFAFWFLGLGAWGSLQAQEWTRMEVPVRPYVTRLDGDRLTCGRATQAEMKGIREMLDRMAPRTPLSGKYALAPPAANIEVNYSGFTPEGKAAFQRAVDIWSALLITTVPIEIDASFGEIDALGVAGPASFFLEESSSLWDPVALVNQFVEEDLNPDEPDIEITMSDSEDWYYGLDGNPGEDQFDFVSGVLPIANERRGTLPDFPHDGQQSCGDSDEGPQL